MEELISVLFKEFGRSAADSSDALSSGSNVC